MERRLIVREQLIYPLVSFVFGGLFFRGGGAEGWSHGKPIDVGPALSGGALTLGYDIHFTAKARRPLAYC